MHREKRRFDLVPLIVADIYELAGGFRRVGEGIARTIGQTQARWQVLSAALEMPKTVPQIARRLGVSRQNVQHIVEALVGASLACFVDNPDHRRSPHLVLTGEGRSTLATLTRAARKHHEALARSLGDLDLAALGQEIRAVLAAVESLRAASEGKEAVDG